MANTRDEKVLWLTGDFTEDDGELKRAIYREGFSQLYDLKLEVLWAKMDVKLEDFLGKVMSVNLASSEDGTRLFTGMVIEARVVEIVGSELMIQLDLAPKLWLTTRRRNSKIFQNMTAPAIIDEILSDHGITRTRVSTSETYGEREYCVQYRETDFDFISRLMEEEGIYYFFDHADSDGVGETLVFADGSGAHSNIPEVSELKYFDKDESAARRGDHVFEFSSRQVIQSGAVTLRDFDFETPSADLTVARNIAKGIHSYKTKELYDYPGHYRRDTTLGTTRARVRMEAEAVKFLTWQGASTVRTMGVGGTFSFESGEDGTDNLKVKDVANDYLLTSMEHYMQAPGSYTGDSERKDKEKDSFPFPEDAKELYSNRFTVIPKTEPFRAPLTTPWPRIPGLHTAIVTGPSGEEIYTDEHARIKVQFHWDRLGEMNENTTCWVRVVTPWSGNTWGFVAVPRIGQEVVIQFEEGDPDRPICTGMLYNAETPPPYDYPTNKTQSGIRTNSSLDGGGFNELTFEDKAGEELVYFQAQKDHQGLIKNKSQVTIGHESMEAAEGADGDLTVVIRNNSTETINEGDRTFTVETGSEIVTIETDKNVTINNDKTETIANNNTREVGVDDTHTIGGNQTTEIGGDQTNTIGGNQTDDIGTNLDITAGSNITITAGTKIELVVGGSKIEMTSAQIKISSATVKVEGTGMAEVKGKLTQIKADTTLVLNGSVATKIN